MSDQRKVSFVCSSSFASFRRGEQIPERAGRAFAEVPSNELSFFSPSFFLGCVPSFDLVLSAVAEKASYDGEESSFFKPEPFQGWAAAY